MRLCLNRFQSTHPSWGATPNGKLYYHIAEISIHAPIVGCDSTSNLSTFASINDFNPRTHRGMRPYRNWKSVCLQLFQSTHPSWGATQDHLKVTNTTQFQSTHPSWGATVLFLLLVSDMRYFNPRTHRGVRPLTTNVTYIVIVLNFNPRTHRGVRHDIITLWRIHCEISIHAPIVGCDIQPILF